MKKTIKLAAFTIIMVFSVNSFAQTKDEAVNAYNRAVTLVSSDPQQAVNAMREAAEIASKADDADTIQQMAEQQIPVLQYNYATALYKDKKIDEAIEGYKQAHDFAVQYNDNSTAEKTNELLPKLYLSKGINEYKAGQFEEAVKSYTQAIELDSSVARAWLNMGLAYKKLDKDPEMKQAMDKAIEVGTSTNDEKTVEAARKTMGDDLLMSANSSFKSNNLQATANKLEEAISYNDNNPEIFYLYAVTLNKLSKFDEALAQSQKGLSVEQDDAEKKARFYFEMGNAQLGKGDNTAACDSYKKAAVGKLAESANYQIKTVLKCG